MFVPPASYPFHARGGVIVSLLCHNYTIISSYSSCLCLNLPTNSVRARFAISFNIPHVCRTEPPSHPPQSNRPLTCFMFHFLFFIQDSKFQNPNRNTTQPQPQPHPQQAKNSSIKKQGERETHFNFHSGKKKRERRKKWGKGEEMIDGNTRTCCGIVHLRKQASETGGRENNINNKPATS